jgi:hypothetical protein
MKKIKDGFSKSLSKVIQKANYCPSDINFPYFSHPLAKPDPLKDALKLNLSVLNAQNDFHYQS